MTAVDKVLAVLDAGLQSSEEHGYPDRVDDTTLCARCLVHEHAPNAELCSGCRAWMLGDSDVDPGTRDRHSDFMQTLIDSLNRPVEAGARAATRAAMTFVDVPGAPIRVQRLDREGWPPGESESLEGYVVHHVDGDPRNNSIDNLRLTPARANATQNPAPWVRWQYVGDGRYVWEYAGWGASGSWATDDPRPFTVAEYVEGLWRGAQLVDADGDMAHFTAHARPDYDCPLPAAYRVAEDTVAPTGRWLVVCERCGAHYSADRERFDEANAIMVSEGHGTGGSCDPLTRTLRRDYYVDGHGDVHMSVRAQRDWLSEALACMRQMVNDARQRLGL